MCVRDADRFSSPSRLSPTSLRRRRGILFPHLISCRNLLIHNLFLDGLLILHLLLHLHHHASPITTLLLFILLLLLHHLDLPNPRLPPLDDLLPLGSAAQAPQAELALAALAANGEAHLLSEAHEHPVDHQPTAARQPAQEDEAGLLGGAGGMPAPE